MLHSYISKMKMWTCGCFKVDFENGNPFMMITNSHKFMVQQLMLVSDALVLIPKAHYFPKSCNSNYCFVLIPNKMLCKVWHFKVLVDKILPAEIHTKCQ